MKKTIFISALSLLGMFFISFSAQAAIYNYNLIQNGDFENGLDRWAASCSSSDLKNDLPYEGDYYLSLGDYNASEAIAQNIDLPVDGGKIQLSFYLDFNTEDTTDQQGEDYLKVQVQDVYTGEYYINDPFYPSDGETWGWSRQSYDLTSAKGNNVDVRFIINNDNTLLTYADLDNIKVQTKSYSVLRGTVKNSNGKKLKGATVKIKSVKGKLLWSGKTNSQGKFTAGDLKGLSKKAKIIVKKSGFSKVFRKKLKWGDSYQYKFKM
ncbi:MAG: hypothetical protein ABID45_03990 [Patescibacteria group bacterium]